MQTYCYWNGKQCIDLQCSFLNQRKCSSPYYSEYKCKWNNDSQVCEEKYYQCSDLSEYDCDNNDQKLSTLDCIQNSNEEKCVEFACIDQQYCDFGKCSYLNETCGDPQIVNCSIQDSCEDFKNLGNGNTCHLTDQNTCKYYSSNSTCKDDSDASELCNQYSECTYDQNNLICISKSCQIYETKDKCQSIYDSKNSIYTFCFWEDETCSDATYDQLQKKVQIFSVFECPQYYQFFTWDSDAQYCKVCSELVWLPLYDNELSGVIFHIFIFFTLFQIVSSY